MPANFPYFFAGNPPRIIVRIPPVNRTEILTSMSQRIPSKISLELAAWIPSGVLTGSFNEVLAEFAMDSCRNHPTDTCKNSKYPRRFFQEFIQRFFQRFSQEFKRCSRHLYRGSSMYSFTLSSRNFARNLFLYLSAPQIFRIFSFRFFVRIALNITQFCGLSSRDFIFQKFNRNFS